jgi:hypothetical protein
MLCLNKRATWRHDSFSSADSSSRLRFSCKRARISSMQRLCAQGARPPLVGKRTLPLNRHSSAKIPRPAARANS